jgi:hypothetical protein
LAAFITWNKGLDLQQVGNLTLDTRQQFKDLVSKIKADIEQALPPYMIPALFIPVQTLPLTTPASSIASHSVISVPNILMNF